MEDKSSGNDVQERFNRIINELYRGNKRAFAKAADIPATVVENVVGTRQGKPSYDVLKKICANANISADWLVSGEGPMTRKRIPLYDDVMSIGGYNDTVASTDGQDASVSEWIEAGDWFPGATSAIRHYGDSMVEYPSGSILILRRLNDPRMIVNGKNYVVETSEFRITKQLQDDGDGYLTAYSSNRETYPDGRLIHAPIRIDKTEIRHLDLILGCITRDYSGNMITFVL